MDSWGWEGSMSYMTHSWMSPIWTSNCLEWHTTWCCFSIGLRWNKLCICFIPRHRLEMLTSWVLLIEWRSVILHPFEIRHIWSHVSLQLLAHSWFFRLESWQHFRESLGIPSYPLIAFSERQLFPIRMLDWKPGYIDNILFTWGTVHRPKILLGKHAVSCRRIHFLDLFSKFPYLFAHYIEFPSCVFLWCKLQGHIYGILLEHFIELLLDFSHVRLIKFI